MYLNAYYIHQHHYVLPPRHLQDDCRWMVDNGFDALSIVLNEIDLEKTPRNVDQVFAAAAKAGLHVHLVPSRWAGIVAGTPGSKSVFCMQHPEVCHVKEDGSLVENTNWGTTASIHYPATFEFFCDTLDTVLARWPFDGVIWDEPTVFNWYDRTGEARKTRPEGAGVEWDNQCFADFFDKVGSHIRAVKPDTRITMFVYAHFNETVAETCARIGSLDDFGCDGRPYPGGHHNKSLTEKGLLFKDLAARRGKRSFILIENHDLTREEDALMDRHLPEVLAQGHDHVSAYYYGRNCEDPDGNMAIVARRLAEWKNDRADR